MHRRINKLIDTKKGCEFDPTLSKDQAAFLHYGDSRQKKSANQIMKQAGIKKLSFAISHNDTRQQICEQFRLNNMQFDCHETAQLMRFRHY